MSKMSNYAANLADRASFYPAPDNEPHDGGYDFDDWRADQAVAEHDARRHEEEVTAHDVVKALLKIAYQPSRQFDTELQEVVALAEKYVVALPF